MVLFSALVPPTSVRHRQDNTEAYVNGNCLQSGVLYIAESEVSWINANGFGFTVEYPNIAVHAVSKSSDTFPRESLYMALDVTLPGESEDGDGDLLTTEVRFVPTDPSCLKDLFQTVAACQRLHPDLDQQQHQAEEDWYGDEDDDNAEEGCAEAEAEESLPESEGSVIYQRPAGGVVMFEGGDALPPVPPQGVEGENTGETRHPVGNGCHRQDGDAMDVGGAYGEQGQEREETEADQFDDAECDT